MKVVPFITLEFGDLIRILEFLHAYNTLLHRLDAHVAKDFPLECPGGLHEI
jgi:hypothetical protein